MRKLLPLVACLLAALPAAARAQTYPNRPIKMIVPISVGSVTDVAARLTASELQQRLGQPVVVVDKPGAAMVLGGTECAKSPPDGYTLCVVSPDTMSFNPLTVAQPAVRSRQGFRPGHRHVQRHGRADGADGAAASIRSTRCAPRRWPRPASSITARSASAPPPTRSANGSASIGTPNSSPFPTRAAARSSARCLATTSTSPRSASATWSASSRRARSRFWRSTPRSARPTCPTCRPSRKPASTASPAARSSGASWCRPARRRRSWRKLHDELLAIFQSQKFIDFAKQNYLDPAAGSTGDFAAFLKKDRQDAKVVVDKYMK